ncbi:restriction endonuclease subunit S [Salmonella enterica]|nr:restriction endonuclease subunit S [Salmonella enterica]EHG7629647.1 restriction endonuclease subunit S [Salmonella enterica]EHG7634100.1 restriction endonuclease subunit S [Salmonella enterica]
MSVEKNMPEIRFKGFSGEWDENNLGGLAEIVRGASPRPIEDPKWFDKSSNVGWLRIRDVTEQDGRIHYLEQRISKLGQEKTRVLFDQNLLLSIAASVGKPVINYVETGVHDGFLIFKKPRFELEFMYQWLKSFELEWQQYGQPGSQVNLNSDIVKNQVVFTPCEPEQTQIGNYFQKLDNLINQHQQKHDKLSNIKKAMLEKMFPKQGETMPEIRFKGFSGEWEEIELSDEVTFINGRAYSQEELLDKGKYTVLRVGNFYTNSSWYYSDLELGDKYYADNGDLLYTWSASFGPHIWNGDKVIYHYHIWKLELSENVDKLFLLHLLDYDRAKILSGSNGSTMIHITKSAMEAKKVFIPKKDEQIVIGNYFQKLDVLIKHHQQQITKLNNIKQACLSKMFV